MGASLHFLDQPNKEIEFETGEDSNCKFVSGEMQGWRLNMEDATIQNLKFDSNRALFGVFDGHGGGEVAKYTKRHFFDQIRQQEEYKQGNMQEALRKGFLQVDTDLKSGGLEEVAQIKRDFPPKKSPLMSVFKEVIANRDKPGEGEGGQGQGEEEDLDLDKIGCTANVVMIDYALKKIIVANAGDSRCVMGKAGKAVPLSFDHKPESEVEIKRIEAAGSVITDGRVDGNLNLTRSLGDLKYKTKEGLTPEEYPITANPDTYTYDFDSECDFIIMGCDGVWEVKSNEEMVEYIYDKLGKEPQNADLNQIVTDLLYSQLSPNHTETEGLGCDNMSCILIVFKKDK